MNAPTLDFYYFDSCPYCQRVIKTIEKLNISVNWKDIYADKANMNFLVEKTGRKTVPCLFIDGQPMHESLEIMAWLEENVDTLNKK